MTYRQITKEELDIILAKHKEWLSGSTKGERANLRYANLRYANLRYANLRYADLRYANLRYANLRYANLRYADLSYADLSYADLHYADLRYADLSYADLSYADLHYADLSYADLLIFQFNRNIAYFTMDGTLRIGCECLPISEWIVNYKNIGTQHGYSDLEIEAYGDFIRSCLKVFEAKNGVSK